MDEGLKAQCRQLQNQVVDLEHDLATVTERYTVAQREEGSQAESLSTELNDLRARLRRSEEGRVDAQHKLRDLRTTLDDNQTQLAGEPQVFGHSRYIKGNLFCFTKLHTDAPASCAVVPAMLVTPRKCSSLTLSQ